MALTGHKRVERAVRAHAGNLAPHFEGCHREQLIPDDYDNWPRTPLIWLELKVQFPSWLTDL